LEYEAVFPGFTSDHCRSSADFLDKIDCPVHASTCLPFLNDNPMEHRDGRYYNKIANIIIVAIGWWWNGAVS